MYQCCHLHDKLAWLVHRVGGSTGTRSPIGRALSTVPEPSGGERAVGYDYPVTITLAGIVIEYLNISISSNSTMLIGYHHRNLDPRPSPESHRAHPQKPPPFPPQGGRGFRL